MQKWALVVQNENRMLCFSWFLFCAIKGFWIKGFKGTKSVPSSHEQWEINPIQSNEMEHCLWKQETWQECLRRLKFNYAISGTISNNVDLYLDSSNRECHCWICGFLMSFTFETILLSCNILSQKVMQKLSKSSKGKSLPSLFLENFNYKTLYNIIHYGTESYNQTSPLLPLNIHKAHLYKKLYLFTF